MKLLQKNDTEILALLKSKANKYSEYEYKDIQGIRASLLKEFNGSVTESKAKYLLSGNTKSKSTALMTTGTNYHSIILEKTEFRFIENRIASANKKMIEENPNVIFLKQDEFDFVSEVKNNLHKVVVIGDDKISLKDILESENILVEVCFQSQLESVSVKAKIDILFVYKGKIYIIDLKFSSNNEYFKNINNYSYDLSLTHYEKTIIACDERFKNIEFVHTLVFINTSVPYLDYQTIVLPKSEYKHNSWITINGEDKWLDCFRRYKAIKQGAYEFEESEVLDLNNLATKQITETHAELSLKGLDFGGFNDFW